MTSPSKEIIVYEGRPLANPSTGEALTLDADTATLAEWLKQIDDFSKETKFARQRISEEIVRRMDLEASWTMREGNLKLTSRSPEQIDYDVDSLGLALVGLMNDGLITKSAAEACIKEEKKLTVLKQGVNALLKRGGQVAEAIRACQVQVDKPRSVRVEAQS